jgi:hypothetical protein
MTAPAPPADPVVFGPWQEHEPRLPPLLGLRQQCGVAWYGGAWCWCCGKAGT